jgi:hypothetical protein
MHTYIHSERPVTVGYASAHTGPHTQQEERRVNVGYTSSQTGPHTDTHNRQSGPSLWDTLAHRRDHIQTQHNRQSGPSLWDTLAHRRDHIQTHNTTTGITTRHCGIHQRTDGTTYRHTQHNRKNDSSLWGTLADRKSTRLNSSHAT